MLCHALLHTLWSFYRSPPRNVQSLLILYMIHCRCFFLRFILPARGEVIAPWCRAVRNAEGKWRWHVIHDNHKEAQMWGSERVKVAGGCSDHPSRVVEFYKSAFLYDGLADTVCPLPDMKAQRHGASGAFMPPGTPT
eukprot:g60020.t1